MSGTVAQDPNDFLIYNAVTGQLRFDADANGTGAALEIANLGAGTALLASDLIIF